MENIICPSIFNMKNICECIWYPLFVLYLKALSYLLLNAIFLSNFIVLLIFHNFYKMNCFIYKWGIIISKLVYLVIHVFYFDVYFIIFCCKYWNFYFYSWSIWEFIRRKWWINWQRFKEYRGKFFWIGRWWVFQIAMKWKLWFPLSVRFRIL